MSLACIYFNLCERANRTARSCIYFSSTMGALLLAALIAVSGCGFQGKEATQKSLNLTPTGSVIFAIDAGRFWFPNTVIFQALDNGAAYAYDIASRELVLFDSSGRLIRHYGDAIERIGKYYSIITDVAIDCTGNIVLNNHQKGEVFIIDASTGLVQKKFATQSITWLNILPYSKTSYLLYSSARTSRMPTIFIYDADGRLMRNFGEMESEVLEHQYALHSAGRQVATDTAGNIYAVHPAFYRVQKYDASGNLVKTFSYPHKNWHQVSPQKTDVPNRRAQYSIIELLATTSKYVLVFSATNKDERITHRWLDIYDFNGKYLSTLDIKVNEKPVCVSRAGEIWFARTEMMSANPEENNRIWIQKYDLNEIY